MLRGVHEKFCSEIFSKDLGEIWGSANKKGRVGVLFYLFAKDLFGCVEEDLFVVLVGEGE